MQGRWATARELCEQAERMMRERCTGVAWQMDTAHLYTLLSLFYLGEISELSRRLPTLLKEARDRDALYAETNLRTRLAYIVWLAADDAEQAEREVRQGMAIWSQQGFHIQHYYEMIASAEIALYVGTPEAAWTDLDRKWRDLRQSLLLRVQPVLIESLYLRARVALAAAVQAGRESGRRGLLLRAAARDARNLSRQDAPWAKAIAHLLEASLATMNGRPAVAGRLLRSAHTGLQEADMPLHAAVARRRAGELAGGSSGEAVMVEANMWMRAQGIRDPDRMSAALAPGEYVASV
jgi:hypothetical protein